jgi:hypothetical protein
MTLRWTLREQSTLFFPTYFAERWASINSRGFARASNYAEFLGARNALIHSTGHEQTRKASGSGRFLMNEVV